MPTPQDIAAEVGSKLGVVSNNVGPGFSTAMLGMGLRFTERKSDLRAALERLCEEHDA
jgi:hypothetical protein